MNDPNVKLTVDFLFWDRELLNCRFNDESWALIHNHLGSTNEWNVFQSAGECNWLDNLITPKTLKMLIGFLVIEIVVLLIIVGYRKNHQGAC